MPLTFLHLAEYALVIVINVVLAVVAFRAYNSAIQPERSLSLLGISGVLGVIVSVCGVLLEYFSVPADLRYDGSTTLMIVGMIDSCLWIWSVCTLMKRYVALEAQVGHQSPKDPA
jgi:hypothetical protein